MCCHYTTGLFFTPCTSMKSNTQNARAGDPPPCTPGLWIGKSWITLSTPRDLSVTPGTPHVASLFRHRAFCLLPASESNRPVRMNPYYAVVSSRVAGNPRCTPATPPCTRSLPSLSPDKLPGRNYGARFTQPGCPATPGIQRFRCTLRATPAMVIRATPGISLISSPRPAGNQEAGPRRYTPTGADRYPSDSHAPHPQGKPESPSGPDQ